MSAWFVRTLTGLAFAIAAALPAMAEPPGEARPPAAADGSPVESRFFDTRDGWLDVSGFLDTAYGFVPVVAPITEPAVGYGAVGALVFIDRPPAQAARVAERPNIAVVGAAGTQNGTQGVFALHLGTWLGGRLRTLVGLADADVNLDFFGLGGDRLPSGLELGYTVAARGGVAGGNVRIGDTPLWIGVRYARAKTRVDLGGSDPGFAGISAPDLDLQLAAVTPSLTLDARDNFFTPTAGWYVYLSVPLFREALGSDRDFERATLTAIHYRPLSPSVFFSVRGTARASTDGTPFFLRPYVVLRGVQAMRYQGEQAGELEVELRWQAHPRFSLVGFGGAGLARSSVARQDREQTATAAGAGFRYLLARKYGIHMGVDLARGPDGWAAYVVFGSAWLRP